MEAERKPLTPIQKAAVKALWAKGVLGWKFDAAQSVLDADVMAKRGNDRVVICASRGWGKTFYLLIKLFEECLQKPNRHCAFVTKTKTQARSNIRQSAETILEDCPPALRPRYIKNEGIYEFANGSTLSLLGVDAERFDLIRGRALNAVAVDEAQSIDQLRNVIDVVLDPAVLRVNGWFLITGTVPETGTHDFVDYIRQALARGNLVKKTVYECPRYRPEQIENFCYRAGGAESSVWKREYLCLLEFDETRQVVSEWNEKRAAELTQELERPQFCQRYVGLDFGFSRDLTVAVFGHHDFARNALVIEDELALKGGTTVTIAKAISDKELALWGEFPPDVHRWADGNEPRTIHELRTLHKIIFKATDKKAKLMHLNGVRMLIAEGRLFIHPRCKLLLRTLAGATWAKNHKTYDRDPEIGHADALDALLYLSRNIDWKKNPTPKAAHWIDIATQKKPEAPISPGMRTLKDIYSGDPNRTVKQQVLQRLGRRRF